jgi:hypothetical protein
MAAPPAYLDECIDHYIVAPLQSRGFDVRHVNDEHTNGYSDEQPLEYATQHGWVFITQNQREFRRRHRDWLLQGRAHAGLILNHQSRSTTRALLRVALTSRLGRLQPPQGRVPCPMGRAASRAGARPPLQPDVFGVGCA